MRTHTHARAHTHLHARMRLSPPLTAPQALSPRDPASSHSPWTPLLAKCQLSTTLHLHPAGENPESQRGPGASNTHTACHMPSPGSWGHFTSSSFLIVQPLRLSSEDAASHFTGEITATRRDMSQAVLPCPPTGDTSLCLCPGPCSLSLGSHLSVAWPFFPCHQNIPMVVISPDPSCQMGVDTP